MVPNELDGLINEALRALSKKGLSQVTIAAYRRYGFEVIKDYFKEQDLHYFTEPVAARLVLEKRRSYENKETSLWEWAALRKSAACLKSLQETGEISASILPKWNTVQNPLRRPLSDEQLRNKDDVFVLAHLTKHEMGKFGYSDSTMKKYVWQGFDPILQYCVQNVITNYCKKKIGAFVEGTIADPDIPYRTKLMIQRAALMIDEYYHTGTLEWRQLKPAQQRFITEQFSNLLDDFCLEREKVGVFADSTLASDRVAVRQFLIKLEDMGHTGFGTVSLNDVAICMTALARQCPSMSYLSCIRNFLKFLHKHDETAVDLCVAIPRVVPPRVAIQEGFTQEEIDSLLNCADRDTAIGKRDYAIIMLASQTGLRAVDIANLKFTEINWRSNTIKIAQEKTARGLSLPLPAESGNAVADYILNGRPDYESPFIFLRLRRPFQKIRRQTVGSIVLRFSRRSGMEDQGTRRKGFHGLRRAFGGRLLETETPLELLSELLGHSHADSSKPYLSANESGLKSCALNVASPGKAGDAL